MFTGISGGSEIGTIKQALEAARLTQKEVNHNLANLDTPGYASHNTDFKALLLQSKQDLPVRGKPFQAYMEDIGQQTPGVNVEAELARLSQTSLEHSALITLLNQSYSDIRSAINEGKGG